MNNLSIMELKGVTSIKTENGERLANVKPLKNGNMSVVVRSQVYADIITDITGKEPAKHLNKERGYYKYTAQLTDKQYETFLKKLGKVDVEKRLDPHKAEKKEDKKADKE